MFITNDQRLNENILMMKNVANFLAVVRMKNKKIMNECAHRFQREFVLIDINLY